METNESTPNPADQAVIDAGAASAQDSTTAATPETVEEVPGSDDGYFGVIIDCDPEDIEWVEDPSGTENGTDGGTGTENGAGTELNGADQTGTDQSSTDKTGTDETGTDQTGTDETGTEESGASVETGQKPEPKVDGRTTGRNDAGSGSPAPAAEQTDGSAAGSIVTASAPGAPSIAPADAAAQGTITTAAVPVTQPAAALAETGGAEASAPMLGALLLVAGAALLLRRRRA